MSHHMAKVFQISKCSVIYYSLLPPIHFFWWARSQSKKSLAFCNKSIFQAHIFFCSSVPYSQIQFHVFEAVH